MALLEQFENSGNWLFRWRSYLPLAFAGFIVFALPSFHYPFGSHLADEFWELLCMGVSLFGFMIRAVTVGSAASRTSGRNTDQQVADTLNTTGMYSIVRNPLYLGNFFMLLGVISFLRIWWLPLVYVLLFTIYYERIIFAEEMFLRRKFGDAYLSWAAQTPAFLPRFSRWQPPAAPISLRKILRREYHGVFGVVFTFFFLELAGDLVVGHGFVIDSLWKVIIAVSLPAYLLARWIHKRTAVLKDR